mmetsp:Transcript_6578/g.15226  ORF Transcript_6578/g.15226 Transcript_6578/m.15226 type:complete len:600 (+) Transcript_6578:53-1852(+)
MPRRGRSSSRHRTRRRGSSARRQRRSRSRARPQRRKRQREASSASDAKKKADAGSKKTEGKKKAKKAEKTGKADKADKGDKAEKPAKAAKAGKAEKAHGEKVEKPAKADKPDKAEKANKASKAEKAKKTKEDKAEKGEDGGKAKTKSKKKDPAAKADATKKAKAKKGGSESSSGDSSYSYYSSSSEEDEQQQQQQQQQFMSAMMPWAMMQGAMPTAAMGTSGQLGMAGYAQYAAGQYPGYGASYGYTDPYGRPYGSSMGEQVPAGYQAPPPPPPPGGPGGPGGAPYMHGPMTDHDRIVDERDKARRRLEDEARLRNEELHRKAETERATAAVRNAISNLQHGQFDSLDGLLKTLESVAERDLSKTEGQKDILKHDMEKAIEEAQRRREVMAELKSMVRSGEEHIKATADLIRENVALQKEKDREDMNDQLENAGLEAQGMSDRYQSFMDEHSKDHEELQSFTKGPALVDLRLVIAKIKKLSSDLTMTATNAASVVREGKQKLARREAAIARTKRMQELFDQYDADKDGCLSQLEVLQYSQGEFEFTPAEACLEKLWQHWVPAGMAGITFDRFQQMKIAIGTARFIEKDQERRPAEHVVP